MEGVRNDAGGTAEVRTNTPGVAEGMWYRYIILFIGRVGCVSVVSQVKGDICCARGLGELEKIAHARGHMPMYTGTHCHRNVCSHKHTHTRKRIHVNTQTRAYTRKHKYSQGLRHTQTRRDTHPSAFTCTQTQTHANANAHKRSHTCLPAGEIF